MIDWWRIVDGPELQELYKEVLPGRPFVGGLVGVEEADGEEEGADDDAADNDRDEAGTHSPIG